MPSNPIENNTNIRYPNVKHMLIPPYSLLSKAPCFPTNIRYPFVKKVLIYVAKEFSKMLRSSRLAFICALLLPQTSIYTYIRIYDTPQYAQLVLRTRFA